MSDTLIWKARRFISSDYPEEYKQHEYEHLKRQVSCELFDILYQQKLPAVVDISHMKISPSFEAGYSSICVPSTEISIEVRVTPVKYQDVTLVRYRDMPLSEVTSSAIDELKLRAKHSIRKLFRK